MSLNKNPRSKKESIITLLASLALLIAFFYFVPLNGVLDVLKQVRILWFLAVVGFSFFVKMFVAQKFRMFLEKQGVYVPFFQLYLVNITAEFYAFFSPLSSVGTVVRWKRLIPPGKGAEGLAAFGAYRIFDILFVLSIGILWGLASIDDKGLSPSVLFAYFVFLFFLIGSMLKFSPFLADWLDRKHDDATNKISKWVLNASGKFSRSIGIYRTFTGLEILRLLTIALAGDFISLCSFMMLAKAVDIPISFIDFGWIRSFAILVAIAPLTLPGGIGMREVSVVVLMTGLGIDIERATAFSVLMYARSLTSALMGGAVELITNLYRIKSDGYSDE